MLDGGAGGEALHRFQDHLLGLALRRQARLVADILDEPGRFELGLAGELGDKLLARFVAREVGRLLQLVHVLADEVVEPIGFGFEPVVEGLHVQFLLGELLLAAADGAGEGLDLLLQRLRLLATPGGLGREGICGVEGFFDERLALGNRRGAGVEAFAGGFHLLARLLLTLFEDRRFLIEPVDAALEIFARLSEVGPGNLDVFAPEGLGFGLGAGCELRRFRRSGLEALLRRARLHEGASDETERARKGGARDSKDEGERLHGKGDVRTSRETVTRPEAGVRGLRGGLFGAVR